MQTSHRAIAIVVVEAGAPWPGVVAHQGRLSPDCVVLAQDVEEQPLDFARRVSGRVRKVLSEGSVIRLGVLAAHHHEDAVRTESRMRIARALVSGHAEQETELLFVTKHRNRTDHLEALAETFREQLGANWRAVRVCEG